MIGPLGYGRYNDDPAHVGCPRAQSDMTPCIARDGGLALADDHRCVGCYAGPRALARQLLKEMGKPISVARDPVMAADVLRDLVRKVTEPSA